MSDVRGEDPTIAGSLAEGPDLGLAEHERIAGRWEIVAVIGTGGMGNVYRALDHELGEPVALKVLHRTVAPDALERFRDEVKLARRVTHVNVARTHDIGKHGDSVFLTMELIDGEPLSRRISRGRVAWREAVSIGRAICAGVGTAHAAGVVHRDLKPDNVMLARDGRCVVTDFGIASRVAFASGDTIVEITGTPAWMAPEQLAGTASARSDVYAIGEILWTMLTGVNPWLVDGTIDVLARTRDAAPQLPRHGVPDSIALVIECCLAREPARRFGDAFELGEALAGAETAASVAGTPAPAIAPARARDVHVGVGDIRNLGDPADDYVAAGLAEDLIDMLGRARGIRVRPLTPSDSRDDLDVVVTGSLRRAGDVLRITVRAVGARDNFQIWGARFDRGLDEILKVSDEVAREVATALSTTAGRGGIGRDVAADQVVVELYLRARQLIETGWLDDPRPLTLYQTALERDPDSPVLLAGYATLLARRINAGDADASEAVEAQIVARRALARGPELGEPWVALAALFFNSSRQAPALRAIRIALERGPGLAEAFDTAGRILLELDPALDEAVALLERARWANPRLPNNFVDLVRAHGLRGNWDRVDELLRTPGTESPSAQAVGRARMQLWRGPLSSDVRVRMEVPGLSRFRWISDIINEAISAGALTDAVAAGWQSRVHGMPPGSRMRRYFAQLGAEIGRGLANPGFAWTMIDEAIAHGLVDVVWLDRMPLFEPIRTDPRFVAAHAVVAARCEPLLAVWRGPLPVADVDGWLAAELP